MDYGRAPPAGGEGKAEVPAPGPGKAAAAPGPGGKTWQLPPFLTKTYELVERSEWEEVVSWNEEGTAFVVWLPEELSQHLLPRYFKHSNFSSFIRQLNTYGFRKSAADRWEFRHEKFQRGKAHLLGEITRRKCEPSVYPSFLKARRGKEARPPPPPEEEDGAAAAAAAGRLLEENRVLQRENSELLLRIAEYRALESELTRSLSRLAAAGGKRARLQQQAPPPPLLIN